MLLSQLLKLTIEEHIDYKWEQTAVDEIKALITNANEKKKNPEVTKFLGTELKRTSVAAVRFQ
jgi:hypothetical protein